MVKIPAATDKILRARLRPLYIAAFLQGFVLWYAIEKLFMKSIGFDDATIGLSIAGYSAVILLTETPSGILADRWSRRGVLILASVALVLSSLIGGLSQNIPAYLISAGFWGLFYSMYSGTYDSVVYDTLVEETGSADSYDEYYGRLKVMDSIGLVLGSVLGGVVGHYLGLGWSYMITIPLVLGSIIALLLFREPRLHKADVPAPLREHIYDTFHAVLRQPALLPVAATLITITSLFYIILEFGQLWVIALAAPVILYGPINALQLSTFGLGGIAASRFKVRRRPVMFVAALMMLVCSIGLALSHNLALTVACLSVLCICIVAVLVVFTRLLHDALPSRVRAGSSSAISTLGRIIIIPLAILFGFISKQTDIFHASWIVVGLVVVAVFLVVGWYGRGSAAATLTTDAKRS